MEPEIDRTRGTNKIAHPAARESVAMITGRQHQPSTGVAIIKPPSGTLENECLGTLLNRAATTTLAAPGLGLFSVASAQGQLPTLATREQAQAEARLQVLHQSFDYREGPQEVDLTRGGPAGWICRGPDWARKASVGFRKADVLGLIGQPRLVASTNRVCKNNRPLSSFPDPRVFRGGLHTNPVQTKTVL